MSRTAFLFSHLARIRLLLPSPYSLFHLKAGALGTIILSFPLKFIVQPVASKPPNDAVDTDPPTTLAQRLEDLLPQTQCTKCGFDGCRPYAQALAAGHAGINQCPPGGQEGVVRLARQMGQPVIPLNPVHGQERPRPVARIDETRCIGCTLCIQACPVDAILGAAKQMHVILPQLCTGCDLCVAPCPVDCIDMVVVTPGRTGWAAWSQTQADDARARHDFRAMRLRQEREAHDARLAAKAAARQRVTDTHVHASAAEHAERTRKQTIIAAAIARVEQQKDATQQEQSSPLPGFPAQPALPEDGS